MKRAIGIDIGGTKIAIGAVDETGMLAASASLPTESQAGFENGRHRLIEGIERTLETARWRRDDILGIGIGCAGPLDPHLGIIRNPFTLPGWDDAPVVAVLSDAFKTTVLLENDADAALVGECLFGAARDADPVAMLTFGTGVGGAVFVNKKIVRGFNGVHPEPGHMRVAMDGPPCYCGTTGCLESIASGTALTLAGRSAGFSDAPSLLIAARRADPAASTLVAHAILAIQASVWNLAHLYAPQRIVLGGGIMEEHFDFLTAGLDPLWKSATQVPCELISVVQASLGNRAGVVGAAGLVFLNHKPPTTQ